MNRTLSQSSRLVLSRSSRGLLDPALRNGSFRVPVATKASGAYISRRHNSSEIVKTAAVSISGSTPSSLDVPNIAHITHEKLNFMVEHVMSGIDVIHTFSGMPYWGAIVVATVGIRLILLPIALKTMQESARMAAARPEIQKVQDKMANDLDKGYVDVKMRYEEELKNILAKHEANPSRALFLPFLQFPVVIALFVATRDMSMYYPGFATGGALWFANLSVPDALLLLPIFNSLSFLAMIEMGTQRVQLPLQQTFNPYKNLIRGMAVLMVPLTMGMPQGMLVYWSTNNLLSVLQAWVLRNANVRRALDIPDAEDDPAARMIDPLNQVAVACFTAYR